jgi:hypothetical protein
MSRLIQKDKEKLTICLDFDGVFNEYQGYDGDNIGRPRPGLREFLEHLNLEYTVVIVSARRYTKIISWLNKYNHVHLVHNVTSYKVPAVAYIDDRGVPFTGDYTETLRQLHTFKPYWQQ